MFDIGGKDKIKALEEELAAIKKQADELHNQKENLSKVNEELSSSNEELKHLMIRIEADINKTTENHKEEVNSLKENIERLAYKMNLLSDKEQAKKWLDGYLTEFEKYYDMRAPEGTESLDSNFFSDRGFPDMTSLRAIDFRNIIVNNIIERLNIFDTDDQKAVYLHLIFPLTSDPISFEHVILAVLLLRKFADNVSINSELKEIIFKLLRMFCILSNKDVLSGNRAAWLAYGWSEEYYLKSFIWDAILIPDKYIQELALCALIDIPHRMEHYYESRNCYSSVTYFNQPRNYYIPELLRYDYPRKANILVDALERICIMEKICYRDQFDELWCLFFEAIKNNIKNQNNLNKIFESIVDIGKLDYCSKILYRLVAEKSVLKSVEENIVSYCDSIIKLITSNPKISVYANRQYYLTYSHETLNSFLVTQKMLSSNYYLSGYINSIVNAFKALWYNNVLQEHSSLTLFSKKMQKLVHDNHVNCVIKNDDDKIIRVFQDEKITNENRRRLLDQASANGDIWAISTRLIETIRRKGGYRSTENSKVEIGLLEKLANDGDVESMYMLGEIYRDGGEKTLSMMWYEKAASENYSDAMVKIGYLFESDFKYKEAFVWYKKAAELESAYGMYYVGADEDDIDIAKEWLLKASILGLGLLCYSELGKKYYDLGDIASSKIWYAKAIFSGDSSTLPDEIYDDFLFFAGIKEEDFYNEDKEYIENKLRELDESAT
ncbi:MAG: hypothetical protein ACOYLR_10880 [Chlorobium sp.]